MSRDDRIYRRPRRINLDGYFVPVDKPGDGQPGRASVSDLVGTATISISHLTTNASQVLVNDGGNIKYRTTSEIISDLGLDTRYLRADQDNTYGYDFTFEDDKKLKFGTSGDSEMFFSSTGLGVTTLSAPSSQIKFDLGNSNLFFIDFDAVGTAFTFTKDYLDLLSGREYPINGSNIITPDASFDNTNDILGASMKAIDSYVQSEISSISVDSGYSAHYTESNHKLSSMLDFSYSKNSSYQESTTSYARPHGVTYHDGYFYVLTGESPSTIIRYDATDITSQTTYTFASDGLHNQALELWYYNGYLYTTFGGSAGTYTLTISQIELDLSSSTDVYTLTGANTENSTSAFCIANGKALIASESPNCDAVMYVVDCATWTLDTSYTITTDWSQFPHSIIYDGEDIFVITNDNFPGTSHTIYKCSFTSVVSTTSTGSAITDDMADVGSYLYCGREDGSGEILIVDKHFMTKTTLSTGVSSSFYTVFFDGRYVWGGYATTPGKLVRIDPIDNSMQFYTFNSTYNQPNEIVTDGSRYFVTFWSTSSPFKVMLFTTRWFDEGMYYFDSSGNKIWEWDDSNGIDLATGLAYSINGSSIITPTASFDDTNDSLGASMKAIKDYGDANWASGGLPSQTGNANKLLTTDGSTASWTDVIDSRKTFNTDIPCYFGTNSYIYASSSVFYIISSITTRFKYGTSTYFAYGSGGLYIYEDATISVNKKMYFTTNSYIYDDGSDFIINSSNDVVIQKGGSDYITINSNNTQFSQDMYLVDGKKFGIGNTSASYDLHLIDDTAASDRGLVITQHNSSVSGGNFYFEKSRGTHSSISNISSGDYVGGIAARGYYSGYLTTAGMLFQASGTLSSTNVPIDIIFWVKSSGTTGSVTSSEHRLKIGGDGNVYLLNIPTSSSGLSSGALYKSSGYVRIV